MSAKAFDAFRVARWLRDVPDLSVLARLIAYVLLSYAQGDKPDRKKRLRPGESSVSALTLATHVGRELRRVRLALAELKSKGVISVRSGQATREVNVYRFELGKVGVGEGPGHPMGVVGNTHVAHDTHVSSDTHRVSSTARMGVASDTLPALSPTLNPERPPSAAGAGAPPISKVRRGAADPSRPITSRALAHAKAQGYSQQRAEELWTLFQLSADAKANGPRERDTRGWDKYFERWLANERPPKAVGDRREADVFRTLQGKGAVVGQGPPRRLAGSTPASEIEVRRQDGMQRANALAAQWAKEGTGG